MSLFLQICIAGVTLAFVAIAVALVRMLNRLSKTIEEINTTLPMIQRSITQVEKVTSDAHEVLLVFAEIAPTLRRTADLVEGIGKRAAGISNVVLDEVESPVRRAVSLVRGIRAGASALVKRRVRRRDDGEESPTNGEIDDE
jgi:hypothetical protein